MAEAWIRAAAHAPAPWFVLVVTLLVIFSVAGIPLPITITLLLAGALTSAMPHGGVVLFALVIAVALASTLRDGVARAIGVGSALLARRYVARPHYPGKPARSSQHGLQWWQGIVSRWQRWLAATSQSQTITAAQQMLQQRGLIVLSISRFSLLASPLDIAAGMLGVPLRIFLPAVLLGRIPYALLLLGAGAISGNAWRSGASLPSLIGILSVVMVVVIIVPTFLSQRALKVHHPAQDSTTPPARVG